MFLDWLKSLIISLLIPNLFISVSVTLMYFQYYKGIIPMLSLLLLIIVALFMFNPIYMLLRMWLVHGLYVLKDGNMYAFVKNFLVSKQVKEYPIVVLPVASKSTYANAFAIGINKFGCILVSDVLLNNLSPKSFLSVILHENCHLRNNDVLKRFVVLSILLLLVYVSFNGVITHCLNLWYAIIIIQVVILGLIYYSINNKKQELQADLFAAKQLGDGKYMMEALEYLYSANGMPKENEKTTISFHPKLNERLEKLKSFNDSDSQE